MLLKGANFLCDGAVSLAKKLRVSELTIGLTIVSFGTSAPEFFVNIISSIKGASGIALSNIVGSGIANVFLILGLCSLIYPLTMTKGVVWRAIPFSLMAVVLLALLLNDGFISDGSFSILSRIDGLILIIIFVLFLYYVFSDRKKDIEGFEHKLVKEHGLTKSFLWILFGLLILVLGAKLVVDGSVDLVSTLGISERIVGLTIIALGTSLPELATSIVAALRKDSAIAVGNIVGSNIFNVFFILGISALIRPMPLIESINLDIAVVIFANLILLLWMFIGKKYVLEKWQGVVLVLSYVIYIIFFVLR